MNIQINQKPRIIWMMDETIAQTHPSNWQRVTSLEKKLVRAMGNPKFDHQVVSPLECLPGVIRLLHGKKFSCIFDLTGWLTPSLQGMFPSTQIINEFSMSRVRMVSSPKLETTGYVVSMTPKQIAAHRQNLDLSRPLIVDDVSFSGWTSRKTMEMWGLNPEPVTHAFLIANTGNFDGGKPGAVRMLKGLGSNVVFGHELRTPIEDGWHLKDLHSNPSLKQAFVLSLLFQEIVAKNGIESKSAQSFFTHETVVQTIFPEHLSSAQIKRLEKEGRFILLNGHCVEKEAIHARNPFLWASPYFQQHVTTKALLNRRDLILEVLSELRSLTSSPEAAREASWELKREVQKVLVNHSPEGIFVGAERK